MAVGSWGDDVLNEEITFKWFLDLTMLSCRIKYNAK
jgi:hypothetical protein